MLQNSGLGDVIGNAVANASLPLVLVALVISFFACSSSSAGLCLHTVCAMLCKFLKSPQHSRPPGGSPPGGLLLSVL